MPPRDAQEEALLSELREGFAARYGRPPAFAACAPGRVNLIGEHTDYNDGLVLPCAIDRRTIVVGAPRPDGLLRIHSREASPGPEPAELRPAEPQRPAGDWLDYVRGALGAVARATGETPPGLDLAVASDVPGESGLSSSAAFGVALVTAFECALGARFTPETRARLAHESESGFVGVPCGIMDPYASALGRRDHAIRLDCRSREVRAVPLPGDRARILVADSGVRRRLASGGYGDRRGECEAACAAAGPVLAGPERAAPAALRDVAPDDLPALEAALDPVLFRRLRHVVTENARVDAFAAALEAGDLAEAGRLLREGQASLRDDFAVSVPELDTLCAVGDATPGVLGSRLTGAGFGGCTVHLVEAAKAADAARALAEGFAARHGRTPPVFEIAPADGARILS